MNLKRAVGFAAILYIASFIIGFVSCWWLGYDFTSGDPPPDHAYSIGMVAAVVLTYAFTRWYLLGRPSYDIVDGALFGLVAIVVGFILDIVIFAASMGGDLSAMMLYYSDARFAITLILIMLTATLSALCSPRRN